MTEKKAEPAAKAATSIQHGPELTKEQYEKLLPVKVDPVYAGTFNLQGTGNDFSLAFQRSRPLTDAMGNLVPGVAVGEVVAVVNMSPQALKDLWLLLGIQLQNHEKEYGAIETDYGRRIKKSN